VIKTLAEFYGVPRPYLMGVDLPTQRAVIQKDDVHILEELKVP
jgi:hypothetical protein